MDETFGVQGSLGTQYVSPVFGKLPFPVGQTFPTQAESCSLHRHGESGSIRGRDSPTFGFFF